MVYLKKYVVLFLMFTELSWDTYEFFISSSTTQKINFSTPSPIYLIVSILEAFRKIK